MKLIIGLTLGAAVLSVAVILLILLPIKPQHTDYKRAMGKPYVKGGGKLGRWGEVKLYHLA